MRGFRIFWFDLCRIMMSQRFYWLAVPLFLISGFIFSVQIMDNCLIQYPEVTASLGDVLLHCFAGNEISCFEEGTRDFRLPMLWLAVLLGSSLSVLGYAEYFTAYGQQVFLRSPKRWGWWLSKCVWNIITTMTYFLMGILTLAVFVLLKGWRLTLGNTEEVFLYIFPKAMPVSSVPVVQLLLLILAGCVAWNLFQMYLALYIKSFASLLLTMVMMVSSAYVHSVFLPGNYMMLARSPYITGIKDTDIKYGYSIFLILTAISIFGGIVKLKKCDYLVEEEQE